METIVFAGSFDPMTNGHLYIIKEAMKIAENVIVLVCNNSNKQYMFEPHERKEIITNIINDEGISSNVTVEVLSDRYVSEWMTENNYTHLIRGIRNTADFDQEKLITNTNRSVLGDAQTIFIIPPSNLASVSSSFVKGLIGPKYWSYRINNFLPNASYNAILVNFIKKQCISLIRGGNVFKLVISAYSDEDRYYHNLSHLCEVINTLKINGDLNGQSYMYALLHDIVYNGKCNGYDGVIDKNLSDEENSFIIAKNLNSDYSYEFIKRTSYKEDLSYGWEKRFAASDMSILAAPSDIYDQYSVNIRKEYSRYSDEEYNKGRVEVLENLLIYVERNEIFDNISLKQVQKNVNREISKLRE